MEGLAQSLEVSAGFNKEDAEFLDKFCTMTYNGDFDTDIKTDGKKFEFGFESLGIYVQAALEIDKSQELNSDTVAERLQSNCLALLRSASVEEYISQHLIEEDKKLFEKLTNKQDSKESLNEKLMNFVNGNLGQIINNCEADIKEVYTCAYQDTFGLRPYVGVAPLVGNDCLTVNRATNQINKLPNVLFLFKGINKALHNMCGVTVDTESRQIDIRKVISSDKTIYYPKKMLELQGFIVTKESDNKNYKGYSTADAQTWGDYYNKVVKPWVVECVKRALYWSLLSINVNKYDDEEDAWSSDEAQKLMEVALDRLKKSMCFSAIVTQCNQLGGKTTLIKLRVIDVNSTLRSEYTGAILSGLSTNTNTVYEDGLNIAAESGRSDLSYRIWDYKHDYDPEITEAEPNFGYKAAELVINAGGVLSWDKILIGEDLKGTSLFAGKNGSLSIQESLIHYVMAGSRAGKGVMTMNLLASAIASMKPIFYLDRKPDMAYTFAKASDGNMFVVNGADRTSLRADDCYFNEDSGIMLSGWRNAYESLSPEVKSFFESDSYYDRFGDFVYFRAINLILGIIMARCESASVNYEALGGKNGLVVVFDEISNWQNRFENELFSPRGTTSLSKYYATESYIKKVKDIKANIKIANLSMQNASKEEQVVKAQTKLETCEDSLKSLELEKYAYATTLLMSYVDSAKRWSGAAKAGLANIEGNINDIFIIGQDIVTTPSVSIPNRAIPFTKTAGLSSCEENSGSILWGMTEQVSHDWFMGADIGVGHRHMGADKEGTKAHKYLWAKDKNSMKGYWCYVAGASLTTINHQEVSSARYFKPYLVLGNHYEDDTYVEQCKQRVGKYWSDVRKKHLAEPYKSQILEGSIDESVTFNHLNEGIGFEGLIQLIAGSSGSSVDYKAVLKQSADIANYAVGCLGYASFKDYLFDMSPEGIFSVKDIEELLKYNRDNCNPSAIVENREQRLSIYYTLGLIGDNLSDEDSSEDTMMSMPDDAIDDMFTQSQEPVTDVGDVSSSVQSTEPVQSMQPQDDFDAQWSSWDNSSSTESDTSDDDSSLDFDWFANYVYTLAGIDFGKYKPVAIKRIKQALAQRGYHDVKSR